MYQRIACPIADFNAVRWRAALVLCEDNRSVMIYAHHKDVRALTTSFELPEPTTEDAFNAAEYVSLLQGDETEEETDETSA